MYIKLQTGPFLECSYKSSLLFIFQKHIFDVCIHVDTSLLLLVSAILYIVVRASSESTSNGCINKVSLLYFSRYILECPECGVIYRSREYWYGNKTPEECAVRTELKHVWPGVSCSSYIKSSLVPSI